MARETRTRLVWNGGYRLTATTGSGHEIHLDTAIDGGGENSGPGPIETFMTGLGACTSVDVVSILEKMRLTLTSLAVELQAERREEHPRIWKRLEIHYIVESPDAPAERVRHAVELSLTKYCSASAMVHETVPVVAQITLNGERLEPVPIGVAV